MDSGMEIPSAGPSPPGTARISIAASHRMALIGLIALTLIGAGCGGGDDTQQTTLGEGRTPADIAQGPGEGHFAVPNARAPATSGTVKLRNRNTRVELTTIT